LTQFQVPHILAINGGSSSIKFALYSMSDPPERRMHGVIDRIGLDDTTLRCDDLSGSEVKCQVIGTLDHRAAAAFLVNWLDTEIGLASIAAVGHRIVNGGVQHSKSEPFSDALMVELRRVSAWAPEHLPAEIAMVDLIRERRPELAQFACFDTAFHREMPSVAKIMAIPRRLNAKGVERLGFHGLSYAFLMEELERTVGAEVARGRVILAHLGNGASLAAVRNGKSIDTSMGFTPAAGVPMSTRSGDLDPGLLWYLAQTEQMTAEQFNHMINHQSGLLGVSDTSSDVRDLLGREADDSRAADAIAMFCYQIRKCIGAYAAALGGLDTLIFAGGIGENSPVIRARICQELGFLGVQLHQERNDRSESKISVDGSPVAVRVMHTDEEFMIAKSVRAIVQHSSRLSA
jgi:acetate kinase